MACLSGNVKVTFDNADQGNGFDARRRIVVPIGTRSEARLNEMHKSVMRPAALRELAGSMHDFE